MHRSFGVAFLVLAISRIIWGFGSVRYTKFSDFTFSGVGEYIKNALASLKSKVKFDEKSKLSGGHNVASSWAIIAMLVGGSVVAGIGVMIYFIKKTYGKIEILGTMGDFHGILANLIFAVVVCHILGVIFEKLRGGDAINSMLNGKKKKAKFDAIVPRFWVGFFVLSYILAACAFVYFI